MIARVLLLVAVFILLAAGLPCPAAEAAMRPVPVHRGSTSSTAGVRQSRVLGWSRQHRPIIADELGNPGAPFRALVLGSMHGYFERAGEQVVDGIEGLPIPTNIDLWVVRTINPDGDALQQRGNANGVDLNRNWPNFWTYLPPDPGNRFDQHYSGPAPLSEPETVAMYHFLIWLRPNRTVSMHQPLAAVDSTDGGARDPAFRRALAAGLGLGVAPLRCLSVCHGSMTGWLTNHQRGAAITVEFPAYESPAYLRGRAARGVLGALLVGVAPLPAPAPAPAARPEVRGAVTGISASSAAVTVSGWSFDPQRASVSSTVTVFVAGRRVTVFAALPSQAIDRLQRIPGNHRFSVRIPLPPGRDRVCVSGHAAPGTSSRARFLAACAPVTVPTA